MANVLNEIFTLCTKCTVTDKNIFGYQKEAPSSVITTLRAHGNNLHHGMDNVSYYDRYVNPNTKHAQNSNRLSQKSN